MERTRVRRAERLLFGACIGLLLLPVALLAHRADLDRRYVTFLKWVDDQEGVLRGSWADEQQTDSASSLYREVERNTRAVAPDYAQLAVSEKWIVVRGPEMAETFESFQLLLEEDEIYIAGVEIDYTKSEVSANVGVLMLGFRNAVADLMWVKVNTYWMDGLVNRMLPLMYTVVRLDPQFIDAYSVGSWHLAYNIYAMRKSAGERSDAVHEAIDFLEDGLRRNPRNAQLYEDLGFSIYFRKLTDLEQAEVYLTQGTRFEPHEPRMERAAALMIERQRREREALKILEAFDLKHPKWTSQKISIERCREKIRARELERTGDLVGALALWDSLDDGAQAEPVAPLERIRLAATIESRTAEAAGDLVAARAALLRARANLPDAYLDDLPATIARLTERIDARGLDG